MSTRSFVDNMVYPQFSNDSWSTICSEKSFEAPSLYTSWQMPKERSFETPSIYKTMSMNSTASYPTLASKEKANKQPENDLPAFIYVPVAKDDGTIEYQFAVNNSIYAPVASFPIMRKVEKKEKDLRGAQRIAC
mmetsp:Transcript_129243/g.192510  ORF Transcript_129243/g.192510 Transcript_129243/m.192510 type:complete len:134 (-) Transcript_129243:225-626(-)